MVIYQLANKEIILLLHIHSLLRWVYLVHITAQFADEVTI